MRSRVLAIIAAALLACLASARAGAAIDLQANLDRSRITAGESATL